MAIKRYNATLRNLEYRLRAFKDSLPMLLEGIVRDKEDVIVSAIANDICANDVTKVSGPIALFNELTVAQYDRHQIPHFNNYKISRLANVNAIRNSLKNIFSWIPG